MYISEIGLFVGALLRLRTGSLIRLKLLLKQLHLINDKYSPKSYKMWLYMHAVYV